jgi:hypothetical protein
MLSEIDMELTSQTVVFAFFVCQKRGGYCRSFSIFQQARSERPQQRREKAATRKNASLGDCGARQELSHGGKHDAAD